MKQWLAVTLGVVVGLGAVIPPLAVADTPDAELDNAPCFLELVCNNGAVLSCHGTWACDYRPDAPGAPGWISCDGAGWGCDGTIW
ncbi:hypothetical protein [Myxococcus sp. Y35]|uniref:hypothetical protein n=1 Tax=Pseudomyxococcus flavus TaxID=3115648 RepID=UPI003CF1CB88